MTLLWELERGGGPASVHSGAWAVKRAEGVGGAGAWLLGGSSTNWNPESLAPLGHIGPLAVLPQGARWRPKVGPDIEHTPGLSLGWGLSS